MHVYVWFVWCVCVFQGITSRAVPTELYTSFFDVVPGVHQEDEIDP